MQKEEPVLQFWDSVTTGTAARLTIELHRDAATRDVDGRTISIIIVLIIVGAAVTPSIPQA